MLNKARLLLKDPHFHQAIATGSAVITTGVGLATWMDNNSELRQGVRDLERANEENTRKIIENQNRLQEELLKPPLKLSAPLTEILLKILRQVLAS